MKRKNPRKRQEIFNAAARLFARKGYDGTSIRELAETLKLQKGSLYYYFSSKEELLFELLDEYIADALAEVEKICAASDLEPTEKLERFMRFYTRFYAGDRDRLVLLINDIDKLGEEKRNRIIARERLYYRALTGIFAELKKSGIMKDIPDAIAAYAFFGMVHYTCKWFDGDGPVKAESLGEMFLEIFTRGIFIEKEKA